MGEFGGGVDYGTLRTKSDGLLRPYEMRFVRASELDGLFRLHRIMVGTLHHPHAFRPDSKAFMARHIDERGRTVGIFVEGELVAYAAISFPDDAPDNLARDLPLPAEEFRHVADYDGSAVHPNFRGNRLQQRMTDVRHAYALEHDRYHILGTVSPHNAFSLNNFLAMGCRVKNIKQKYGGMTRLIIHRDLREQTLQPFEPGSFREVVLADVEEVTALLSDGYQGFRVVTDEQQPTLCMARPIRPSVAVDTGRFGHVA